MKLKTKRIIALLSAGLLSVSSLTACMDYAVEGDFNESVDKQRTQLYVGNFNGGLGWQWLQNAKERYEALHPEVQIMIDNSKDEYLPNVLINNIQSNRQDMYVLDELNYYKFANAGHLMDITAVVTEGGENSIANKMNDSLRDYYKTADGKYYAVPFYQSFIHFIYDVDLFDQYKLWLNADGTDFVETLDEPRYPGLKGEEGSWDEGLPRTYSQFFKVLDKMLSLSITPITWSGKSKDAYLPRLINGLVADYSGSDFAVNYSYEGTVKTINSYNFTEPAVGTFALDESLYSTQEVTFDTAADVLTKSAAKYYGVKFAKDLMSGGYKYLRADKVNSANETNLLGQDTFLRSRYLSETQGTTKPIAMLAEGGWWFNEARTTFTAMEEYGEEWAMENRRFGVMPFPKADDGSGDMTSRTVSALGGSAIVISNYTNKAEIAKDFFRFIHTEESLVDFTTETYVMRPFDYSIDDEKLATLPYYIQNMVAFSKDVNFEYQVPRTQELKPYYSNLTALLSTTIGSKATSNPLTFFFENTNITSLEYFKGLQKTVLE